MQAARETPPTTLHLAVGVQAERGFLKVFGATGTKREQGELDFDDQKSECQCSSFRWPVTYTIPKRHDIALALRATDELSKDVLI